MLNISKVTTKESLLNLIYNLSELANNIKWSNQKTIMFEAGIIKACILLDKNIKSKKEDYDIKEYEIKISEKKENNSLEKQIKENLDKTDKIDKSEEKEKFKNESKTNKSEKSELNINYLKCWDEVLKELKSKGKIATYSHLVKTKAKKISQKVIEIEFNCKINSVAKANLEEEENKKEIEKILSEKEGNKINIKYIENIIKQTR